MTEKYKIYIPKEMKYRLMNDAELFDFTKKDSSVNLNAFLKEVLINYFDQYCNTKGALLNTIMSDLNAISSISKEDAEKISDKIINNYLRNSEFSTERNTAITLTVSGRSLDIMRSIENNMLSDISLSGYISELLASYLSISRKDRESIIFQDTFKELYNAISNKNVITFSSTSAKDKTFRVQPYLIATSKEEQCNYLLCVDYGSDFTRTFRISRIRSLYISPEKFEPDEKTMIELQEIAKRSPQSASRRVKAIVEFTDKGIQKFHVVTKNRPDVLKKDGNKYYFDWPKNQLMEYFKRFGKEAIIVSPKECQESMCNFYEESLESYKRGAALS